MLLLVVLASCAAFAACGEDGPTPTPAVRRTLPPGVKPVTATPELPTVVPATQTPDPEGLADADFFVRGPAVTLPLQNGTTLHVVERCDTGDCYGFSLPPGTPVLAPFDGTVTLLAADPNTECSRVVALGRLATLEEGRASTPAGTVELVVGCDTAIEVTNGQVVRRGDVLARLGQHGIYEGRPDSPPTSLRFNCSFTDHPCDWAAGSPHYYGKDSAQ